MTLGEKLMQLTVEYQESVQNRTDYQIYRGEPAGREPADIASDYEAVILELIHKTPTP